MMNIDKIREMRKGFVGFEDNPEHEFAINVLDALLDFAAQSGEGKSWDVKETLRKFGSSEPSMDSLCAECGFRFGLHNGHVCVPVSTKTPSQTWRERKEQITAHPKMADEGDVMKLLDDLKNAEAEVAILRDQSRGQEFDVFRAGYKAGRLLGNPKYEYDDVSENSCLWCYKEHIRSLPAPEGEK